MTTLADERRFPVLFAAIAALALAFAVLGPLFSTVAAQEGPGPAKPTGLTSQVSHDTVTLAWDDPNDDSITGYVILRRHRYDDPKGHFDELVADTGTAATTYTDDTVKANTHYTYRIKAINEHGVSERSRWFHIDTPSAPVPAKPKGLSATASHDRVVLTWDDPQDDSITGYVILRRNRQTTVSGQFGELVADTGSAATTYTDDTVAAETNYTYRIKAINEYGASERSRWFHIDTPAAPEPTSEPTPEPTPEPTAEATPEPTLTDLPAKPRSLTAEVAHDSVSLTWADPQDDSITGYVILRRDKQIHEEGMFALVDPDTGSADTTYTDDTVEPDKQYVYRIKAINTRGESDISNWVRAYTPSAPEPTAPEPTPAASERRSVYIDAHNAGVHDLAELSTDADPLNPDTADEGDDNRKAGKVSKSDGSRQGKNIVQRATVNICDRTPEVEAALLEFIADDLGQSATCSTVTDNQLARVDYLYIDGYSSEKIVASDFARLAGLIELYISDSSELTTVPANAFRELTNLTAFERLALVKNNIKTVHPDAFDDLSFDRYGTIFLSYNAIEVLESGTFDDVAGMEDLSLDQNHIKAFDDGFFEAMTDLESLDMSFNRIEAIDQDTLRGLSGLRIFTMIGNNLSTLHPDAFDHLSALERLNISTNALSELPAGLFADVPDTLWEIRLSVNELSSLDPDTFNGLAGLRTLALNHNDLRNLPEDIFEGLSALESLQLQGNSLTSLPEDIFEGLTGLEKLLLGSNRLSTLPEDLFEPLGDDLEWLYLNDNRFISLDENVFNGLSGLARLHLYGNRLVTLPEDVFDPLDDSLTELILNDNNFGSLPEDVFDGLHGVRYLFLHRAGLTSLDPELFAPLDDNLLWLYLFGNRLSSLDEDIFDGLTGLQRLYLQGNNIFSLDEDIFDGLTGLQRLYLDGNDLTTLHENIFDDLSSLQDLNLDENLLTALTADVFDGLDSSLTDLYLRDNILAALPLGIFEGLTGLQRLDLSCNVLTALDLDVFDSFAGTLKYLDLGANSFATPPTEAAVNAKLTALDALYLTGSRPCLPAFDIGLSELSLSTGTLIPLLLEPSYFYPESVLYNAAVGSDVSELTITAVTSNPNAVIGPARRSRTLVYDDDPDTPGLQADLHNRTNVKWRVHAENGARYQDYTVYVYREHPPGSITRLRRLELSGLMVVPDFRGNAYRYEALRPESATQTVVAAIPLDPDASVAITVDGRAAGADGAVNILPDSKTVRVEVTAEDGTTVRTYTVRLVERLDEEAGRSTHAVIELEPVSRYESAEPDPLYQYEPLYDDDDDQIGVTQVDPVLTTRLVGRYEGEIDYPGDVDWVRIEVSKSYVYEIRVDRRASGTGGALKPRFVTDEFIFANDIEIAIVYDDSLGWGINSAGDGNGQTFSLNDMLLAPGGTAIGGNNETFPVWVAVRGGDGMTLVCPTPKPCSNPTKPVYNPHIEVGSYTVRVEELDAPSSMEGCLSYRGVEDLHYEHFAPVADFTVSKQGRLNWPRDVDCHALHIEDTGVDYRIRLLGSATDDGTLPDPRILGVYFDGTMLSNSDDDDGGYHLNSEVVIDPSASGRYLIEVSAPCPRRDDGELLASCHRNVGTYRLEIERVEE